MASEGIPEYSRTAVGNRDLFLAFRNAVVVYCEDEGWEEFYARLIDRLSLELKVDDVFCLGGKGELKKRVREKSDKPRLFFYDKDFDDLTGTVQVHDQIVYLGRYSIENYFLDEDLLVKFVLDHKKGARRARVVSKLDFENRLNAFLAWYQGLCRHFVVSEKFKLGVRGPKLSIEEFCSAAGDVNELRMTRFENDFLKAMQEKQAWLLDDNKIGQELANAFVPATKWAAISDGSGLCHLPGKHLFEFFVMALVSEFGIEKGCRYNFLMTSAERVDMTNFAVVGDRIRAALSAQARIPLKSA